MIYTLDWVRKEAELIGGYWNGSDEKYVDGNGEVRTEEDAEVAGEIIQKLDEIEELMKYLNL